MAEQSLEAVEQEPGQWLRDNSEGIHEELSGALSAHEDKIGEAIHGHLVSAWPEPGIEVMTPHGVDDMVVQAVDDVNNYWIQEAESDDGVVVEAVVAAEARMRINFAVEVYIDREWFELRRESASTRVVAYAKVKRNRDTYELIVLNVEGPAGGYVEVHD